MVLVILCFIPLKTILLIFSQYFHLLVHSKVWNYNTQILSVTVVKVKSTCVSFVEGEGVPLGNEGWWKYWSETPPQFSWVSFLVRASCIVVSWHFKYWTELIAAFKSLLREMIYLYFPLERCQNSFHYIIVDTIHEILKWNVIIEGCWRFRIISPSRSSGTFFKNLREDGLLSCGSPPAGFVRLFCVKLCNELQTFVPLGIKIPIYILITLISA